jgi:myo-inositol-1(or 4)-monophosphatase
MISHTISNYVAVVQQIARDEILTRFSRVDHHTKLDGSLVTAADIAVQERIIDALHHLTPDIPVLSEEMASAQQQALLDDVKTTFWVLDPLDGTSNYVCGFPAFAVSLAFIENGITTIGIVVDPIRDECFTAQLGQGAWLNERPIHTFTPSDSIAQCLAMVDTKRLPKQALANWFDHTLFHSQRNLGTVALDWCWLAAGRFQLYLHGSQRLWDYAAGYLIAQEAGAAGLLFDAQLAKPMQQFSLQPQIAIAAATPELLTKWQKMLNWPVQSVLS